MDDGFPTSRHLDLLLEEQRAYYRAVAGEYEQHWLPFSGGDELVAAIEAFRPTGSVLELACGPGVWTPQLLRHATDLTAVDASPEMLALASSRVDDPRQVHVELTEGPFYWGAGGRA